ncbi:transcriptional regulator [Bifidobacterium sp. SO4]|uniref:transcriptional regulator n=1 Tax=Bifidobacterium sp. SO4 TaxID=2809030 RepID=UPI001C2F240E|nr:transcriptional regulator [Bifidobacterium sp. SO4]
MPPRKSRHAPVEPRFDPVIHEPMRLRICGILATVDELQFAAIRDTLGMNDAACSKHLKTLADCGYVSVSKREADDSRHMVRWYAMTPTGCAAFEAHLAEIKRIAAGIVD